MKKAKIIKHVLVDAKLIIDPPSWVVRYGRTPGDRAKELDGWAKDLMEFIRDHRSQDRLDIYVEREYQDQCSNCHREYEEMIDDYDGRTGCCASCGAVIEK